VVRPKAKKKKRKPSLLDPFRPLIRKLVLEDELTAERVLEEIKATGYGGSYTILKEYIRTFRPKPARRPHERFETEPGEQGQVDLSSYTVMLGLVPTKVVCFSMIFGFSRWQFLRFLLHADARSVSHCHVLAFEEAGGVPGEILYDRMKQVVIESWKYGVLFHPVFEAMVAHYGFTAIPLAPGYKEGKGKVEEPFRYVEGNLLPGRKFQDLEDLNRQAREWRDAKAEREHRTTHEQPAARLDQERPKLIALPERRFDAAEKEPRQVGDDYCIPWDTNRYSAGILHVGKEAWARVLLGELEVSIGEEVVARHRLRDTRYERYVLPEHEAEFREHSSSRHVLAEQFRRLGSGAEEFAEGLREVKGAAAGYHMSRILQLADKVGVLRVAEALRHATRYGAFDSHAVARIVTGRHPPRPATASPLSTPAPVAEFLKGAGSFQRSVRDYERLAQKATAADPEEEVHGQRGDGPADRPPEAAGPGARGPKSR
jgi:transposase